MKLFSILPDSLTELHNKRLEAKSSNFDLSLFINQRKAAYVENGIGYVSIYGALLRDSAPIDTMLGNTDYANIIEDCELCLTLGAKSIIFNIDSPGGTCAGAIETAEYISNLSVPTVGFVSGLCCSAAYWLACGMTFLMSTKSSTNGNIGAIMAYADSSRYLDSLGVEIKTFTSEGADLKSIGYGSSLTEAQTEFLQESINEAGKEFRDFVLESRPDVDPLVFRAGWYGGEKSLELGLIDSVGDEDDAYEYANELSNMFSI
jgi:ClpP class serine protease